MPKWRWSLSGRGRPPKVRLIRSRVGRVVFVPTSKGNVDSKSKPISIRPDEFEALRLVYLEGYTQEEAAELMHISRGTVWRALNNGRRKLVQALIEKRPIVVEPPLRS